ncbi:hypothetical protein NEOLEDRAFT_1151361, partial [Neolentinus lepideus HHB14362 ss-1]
MDYRPAVDLGSVFSPNLRQVSTFFLGGVFWYSLQCFASSPLIQTLLRKFVTLFTSRNIGNKPIFDTEALQWRKKQTNGMSESAESSVSEGYSREERSTLLFILSFCFILASLGDFLASITYGVGADTVCAFVIAWGDMAAHSARLIALFILRFELKSLGMKSLESILFLGWILVGIGLLFATNAINIGITRASCIDLHSKTALSLLALDVMVVGPALSSSEVPDFIPFSVGVILVLPLRSPLDSPVARVQISPLSARTLAPVLPPISLPNHPFSAGSFRVIRGFSDEWPIPRGSADPVSPHPSGNRLGPLLISPGLNSEEDVSVSIQSPSPMDDASDLGPSDRDSPMGRTILPSQIEFAKQFEQEPALAVPRSRRRPDISIVVLPNTNRDDASHVGSTMTLNSAVYGSDIIIYTPSTPKRKRNAMKRYSVASRRSTRSSQRNSASTSATASSSARPYSAVSARTTEELPPLYEGKASDDADPSGRRRTFG